MIEIRNKPISALTGAAPGAGDRRASLLNRSSTPGGAACLISLRHPWRRSNRRPLAGRPCPASLPTTLTAPPGDPAAGDRGHPSVVAGSRDRDVRASRRRSARSQRRRRAVKRGCPSVTRRRLHQARSKASSTLCPASLFASNCSQRPGSAISKLRVRSAASSASPPCSGHSINHMLASLAGSCSPK